MARNSLYPATSPYYVTGVVNNKFLDVMNDRPIPKLGSDRYWTITEQYNNRPDMLAYDLYANPKLWWVFVQRNMEVLKDPIYDFEPGVKIYCPKKSNLQQYLGV